MSCLTDSQLQSLADGEVDAVASAHAASCPACRERVDARRRDMSVLAAMMTTPDPAGEAIEARIHRAVAEGRPTRGATSLRTGPAGRASASPWLVATAVAAAVLLAVFVVLPRLGAPTTLSASEILNRSLKTMTTSRGVESLEYELFVPGEMRGPHRIVQLIDHDQPGRARVSNFGPDGVLESSMGQDPSTNRRFHLIRVDGRNYLIDLKTTRPPTVSLAQMGRALIETAITMMQATSDPNLSIRNTANGRQFVVEMPAVSQPSGAAVFDLYRARAVIDESDYVIREFEASGAVLRQPFSVSFRLIRREVRPSADVPASAFQIEAGPDDVVLTGESKDDPISDTLNAVLRELGRTRGR